MQVRVYTGTHTRHIRTDVHSHTRTHNSAHVGYKRWVFAETFVFGFLFFFFHHLTSYPKPITVVNSQLWPIDSHTKIQYIGFPWVNFKNKSGIPFWVLCVCSTRWKLYDIVQKHPGHMARRGFILYNCCSISRDEDMLRRVWLIAQWQQISNLPFSFPFF